MLVETVRLDWAADTAFLLRDRNDFPVVMTRPSGINGADLLPLSAIVCLAWDNISILKKQRRQVTARTPDLKRIERAIELTETNYCASYGTLKEAIQTDSTLELINE
jgi:uncharacterized OsmC-like protein